MALARLEICNAFNLALNQRRLGERQRDQLVRAFEQALANGFFIESIIPSPVLHDKACELSDRYTPALAIRSLDLLHVAAALLLNATAFFSFDDRQRHVARLEGMTIKPA